MQNWYNNSNHIYLRINNVFYRRVLGIGWQVIAQEQADEATRQWDHLHEKQEAVYLPQLKELGLID